MFSKLDDILNEVRLGTEYTIAYKTFGTHGNLVNCKLVFVAS